MQQIFLEIDSAKVGAWRADRIFVACRSLARELTNNQFDAKAVYSDRRRIGWYFWLEPEAAAQLQTYHHLLTTRERD